MKDNKNELIIKLQNERIKDKNKIEQIINKSKANQLNEKSIIKCQYLNNNSEIKLCGKNFIKKNNNKCKIIMNNKKYNFYENFKISKINK